MTRVRRAGSVSQSEGALLAVGVEPGDVPQDDGAAGLRRKRELAFGDLDHRRLEQRHQQLEKAGDGGVWANQQHVGASGLNDVPVVSRHSETTRRQFARRQTPYSRSAPDGNTNHELWRPLHVVSSERGLSGNVQRGVVKAAVARYDSPGAAASR